MNADALVREWMVLLLSYSVTMPMPELRELSTRMRAIFLEAEAIAPGACFRALDGLHRRGQRLPRSG